MLSSKLILVSLLLSTNAVLGYVTCSVLDYGAVADNSTDLGPAMLSAWKNCVIPHATSTATDTLLYVPAGNFRLNSNVVMSGAVNFNLHIAGSIYLPFNPSLGGTMIEFDVRFKF
jgi:rhamnogalacturonan hydrolase